MLPLFLQIFRAALLGAGGLSLGTAVTLSYEGGHKPLTLAAWYVLGVCLLALGVVFWVVIHRRHLAESQGARSAGIRKVRDEITRIRRELVRLDERRKSHREGTIWPIGANYQELPSEKWNAYQTSLGLSNTDHEVVASAYELASKFNDELARGEGTIASSKEPDPSLDTVREAFDSALAVLEGRPLLPTITLKLDESPDLSLELDNDKPQSRLIEVGVKNPNAVDLKGIHANILMTEGIRAGNKARCDAYGHPIPEGSWARPTPEAIGDDEKDGDSDKDYWQATDLTLPAGSKIFYFRVIIAQPGTSRFRAKFWGGDLPERVQKDGLLIARQAARLGEGRDAISKAILWGEQMRDAPARGQAFGEEDPVSRDYPAWVFYASKAIPDTYFDQFKRESPVNPDPGDLKECLTRDLTSLYDIRAKLARED